LIRISSELKLIGNRREERGKSEARSRKSEVGKDEKIRRSPRLKTLEGNPREMRSAVVNEFHRVNPVQPQYDLPDLSRLNTPYTIFRSYRAGWKGTPEKCAPTS
jgi:hypothetical protein